MQQRAGINVVHLRCVPHCKATAGQLLSRSRRQARNTSVARGSKHLPCFILKHAQERNVGMEVPYGWFSGDERAWHAKGFCPTP